MKRLLHILIVCFILTPLLAGCWDNKDINQRIMPVSIGIKRDGEDYQAFLRIPTPSIGNKSKIVIGEGKTINSLIDTLGANLESNVDLFHVKVITIDEELATTGIQDLISGFMRSREISSKAILLITQGDMEEFFQKSANKESKEGILLLDYFGQTTGWNPHIALTRVWELYRNFHSYTQDIAIPIVSAGDSTIVKQEGSAIFNKDRMVGTITSNETLLYNAFKGLSARGNIEVLNHASTMIMRSKIRNNTSLVHNIPYIQTTIKLEIIILETKGNTTEKQIQEELKKLLTERYNNLISEMQKNQADILGIGQYFRGKLPEKELKNWRKDYLPKLKYDINFKIEIQNFGNLKLSKE